jgi:hypothetical protein
MVQSYSKDKGTNISNICLRYICETKENPYQRRGFVYLFSNQSINNQNVNK